MSQNNIPLPNKISFSKEEDNKSVVVIEPLYPGYGVTVGNALRRVLLSSLPGAAVTGVKIKGADHEFSTVPNVTEDVVDIILNLKQLRLRVNSEEPVRLTVSSKGQKDVKASEIKADSRVEVINPDLVLATLDNKSADFSMELIVERGLGYVPVEQREVEKREIGLIPLDAVFTPVRNVNFEVQNVRVGQITNYDKLTITMETDGSITGREAMDMASQILVDHFALLKTFDAEPVAEEEAAVQELEFPTSEEQVADEPQVEAVASDLDSLGLSNRAKNALLKNNVTSVAQLQDLDRDGLSRLEGLGAKSIDEILKAIGK